LTRPTPHVRSGRNRDLIGQTIKITQGHYKGSIGIVKDATETTARVELHSSCQTISVDVSRIQVIGGPSGKTGNVTTYSRTPTYNASGATPMYRDGGAGTRTPMHDGNTPSLKPLRFECINNSLGMFVFMKVTYPKQARVLRTTVLKHRFTTPDLERQHGIPQLLILLDGKRMTLSTIQQTSSPQHQATPQHPTRHKLLVAMHQITASLRIIQVQIQFRIIPVHLVSLTRARVRTK